MLTLILFNKHSLLQHQHNTNKWVYITCKCNKIMLKHMSTTTGLNEEDSSLKCSSNYKHCGRNFSIKTSSHTSKETREHACWFFTPVPTPVWPTKAEENVLQQGHSGESHPKNHIETHVHRFNSHGHRTHGYGRSAYVICPDVLFQVRTRKQQSGTGTGFSPGTPVFPVSIFPPTLHTRLYLHVCLSEGKTGKRRNIQIKQTFLGISGGTEGRGIGHYSTSTLRRNLHAGRAISLPIVCCVHVLHFGHNFPQCILQALKQHKQHAMLHSTMHCDNQVFKLMTA